MPPFPTVSVLKKVQALHLKIGLPEMAGIDVGTLIDCFQRPLTRQRLTFVNADARADAVLDAEVMLIETIADAAGSAMAYAYVIRLCVLTTVGNHKSEMVVVWQDVLLGSTQAANLAANLYRSASESAQKLAARLT